jgi:hypothetical protein
MGVPSKRDVFKCFVTIGLTISMLWGTSAFFKVYLRHVVREMGLPSPKDESRTPETSCMQNITYSGILCPA